MDGEIVSEAKEQASGLETPKRAFHLDDQERQPTPSIVHSPCAQELDEDDGPGEVDVMKSTSDEFAHIRWYVRPKRYEQYADPSSPCSIPETPPPSDSIALETVVRKEEEGEGSDVGERVVACKHRRTKRKRVEPILSSEEDESTTSEDITKRFTWETANRSFRILL
ncbi:hypothetical protein N0V84_001732 [Fusarium piperis]|uniref:Uncharacterized protein n=1 Tax=Fusarium piperis TaxID=1435070 RepID=A0A9W9BTK9_9HYPO|nr:hypothetical protein N0V84_001732 [Fusarium piperis]